MPLSAWDPETREYDETLFLEGMSRGGVLVSEESQRASVVGWGVRGGGFRRVSDPFVERQLAYSVRDSLPMPDGGLTFAATTDASGQRYNGRQLSSAGYRARARAGGVALSIGPDGVIGARRSFAETLWGIGRWGDVVGPAIATDDPSGELQLLPMDGSAPRPIAAFRWRDVGACAGPRTTEVVLSLRPRLILDNEVREEGQYTSPHCAQPMEAEVEVGPRGVCIRVLTSGREDGFEWLTAGPDGAFEGTSRCRPWVEGDPTPNVRWRPGMD